MAMRKAFLADAEIGDFVEFKIGRLDTTTNPAKPVIVYDTTAGWITNKSIVSEINGSHIEWKVDGGSLVRKSAHNFHVNIMTPRPPNPFGV